MPGTDANDGRPAPRPSRPYYGWIIVAVAMLAVFVSSPGQTYVVPVFIGPIEDDTGWSRTTISGLYTLGSLTAATGILLVGRLMDRFGSRATLAVAGLLLGLAAVWMSRTNRPFDLYVGFALLRLLGQDSTDIAGSCCRAGHRSAARSPARRPHGLANRLGGAGPRRLGVAVAVRPPLCPAFSRVDGPLARRRRTEKRSRRKTTVFSAASRRGVDARRSGPHAGVLVADRGRRIPLDDRDGADVSPRLVHEKPREIGPFPFGWLFDPTGSYRATVLVFVILPAVSALAGLLARPPRKEAA